MITCQQIRRVCRHIHNQFFLITDKIEKGDVTMEHRETKEIWADGNAKTLQGAKFILFRHKIIEELLYYDDDAEMVKLIFYYCQS